MVKRISKTNVIYKFSAKNKPVETASPGDLIIFETIDCLGGQIRNENDSISAIDWSRVNGATGPLYVKGAEPGDTLAVEILDISVDDKAFLVTVPGNGVLSNLKFSSKIKMLKTSKYTTNFSSLRIKSNPMIGTIGVAPAYDEIPCGDLGRHGGNMDVPILNAGSILYLPVTVEGALLALGDLHAVQADGELCVSAAETSGEVLVRINLIKKRQPRFPILENKDIIAILAFGNTIDEAIRAATEYAVETLMISHKLSFEEAYMLGSLIVNLRINQLVDPKKGVRAEISKDFVKFEDFLGIK
ncbi:MAG: acetamidase/formamidase family protein [Nitrososphaeria archaeon]|nr:acetamidase/formamidase family protein [Nitrososphaeria archaeon]